MRQYMLRVALAALLPSAAAAVAQTPPPPSPSAGDARPADAGMTLAQFQAAQAARMMTADTDGDGRISLAEWSAQIAARPDRGDRGDRGDGGRSEGHHGAEGGYDPVRTFARLDTNGDGYIDRTEIYAAATRRFQRMDSNGDGILTADERTAAHGGMRRGGGRGAAEDGHQ